MAGKSFTPHLVVLSSFLAFTALAACGGGGGSSNGSSGNPLIPEAGLVNATATSTPATNSETSTGNAMTASGSIEAISGSRFLLDTGLPHGKIDVTTTASTTIEGGALTVGENVDVTGTGSWSTSIAATQVSNEADGTVIAVPSGVVSTAGTILGVSKTRGGETLLVNQGAPHGDIDVTVNSSTVQVGSAAANEYVEITGTGTLSTSLTATVATYYSAAPASVTVSGSVLAATPYGFTLQPSSGASVPIIITPASVITGAALAIGATASVVGVGSATTSVTATQVVVAAASTPHAQQTATPAPTATPSATPPPVAAGTLPAQGLYNSCEIDSALTTMCEQEDAAMVSDGFTWEINYIGLMAHETGSQSLQSWFTYDASIGMGQIIAVSRAINDPVNVLTGTSLVTFNGDSSLANDCGASNNEQIISCIYNVAKNIPGFKWKWYLYDEPGCPNQSIGYCQGTLAGGNYNNVATLAAYIKSIDPTHPAIGTQVGDDGGQTVINNMFSWLTNSASPEEGFDHYPIPQNGNFGTIDDIGTIAGELASTIAANNPSENMYYVGQAFSWYQETGKGCTSVSVCPFPTTAQMQDERDQALYYANKAGKPLDMVIWYYWPDVTCLTNYSGCNAAANRASLKAAAFAPFPTTAPQ